MGKAVGKGMTKKCIQSLDGILKLVLTAPPLRGIPLGMLSDAYGFAPGFLPLKTDFPRSIRSQDPVGDYVRDYGKTDKPQPPA